MSMVNCVFLSMCIVLTALQGYSMQLPSYEFFGHRTAFFPTIRHSGSERSKALTVTYCLNVSTIEFVCFDLCYFYIEISE